MPLLTMAGAWEKLLVHPKLKVNGKVISKKQLNVNLAIHSKNMSTHQSSVSIPLLAISVRYRAINYPYIMIQRRQNNICIRTLNVLSI